MPPDTCGRQMVLSVAIGTNQSNTYLGSTQLQTDLRAYCNAVAAAGWMGITYYNSDNK